MYKILCSRFQRRGKRVNSSRSGWSSGFWILDQQINKTINQQINKTTNQQNYNIIHHNEDAAGRNWWWLWYLCKKKLLQLRWYSWFNHFDGCDNIRYEKEAAGHCQCDWRHNIHSGWFLSHYYTFLMRQTSVLNYTYFLNNIISLFGAAG